MILGSILLEIGLRVVDWPIPGLYKNGEGPLPIEPPSAEGGAYRAYPGFARHRHWDYDVPIYINSVGYRERENRPPVAGEWRIGLFGDSFTAGSGVMKEERFGEIWYSKVKRRNPSTTLWNFGSPWCGTSQSAEFLEAGGDAFHLNEIILAFYSGNDLYDNFLWEQSKDNLDALYREHNHRNSGLRAWIRSHSRLAGFLWIHLVKVFSRSRAEIDPETVLAEHWTYTDSALTQFAKACRGRPFTIWYIPSVIEWDDEAWQIVRKKYDLGEQARSTIRNRVRDWALEKNVPFVDITQWLTGKSAEDYLFPNDGHWNAAGHRLVGEGLATQEHFR